MLLCRSSGFEGRSRRLRRRAEVAEDLPAAEALQAAHDLRLRLPLARTPADIVEGRLVAAHAGDDDPEEGGVGPPVAAAVEPVAGRLAARGRDRAGAAQLRERGLRTDPLRVVADEQQHRRGRARPHPVRLDQLGRAGGGQPLEVGVVAPDLLVEPQPATGDRAQAGLRRRGRRGDRPRPQGREVPDQGHLAGDAVEPLAQGGRGAEDDRLQRHHGLGPSLDRGVARDLEVADHLDRAGARLRPSGGLPAEHGAGGTLGVERVALALPAPQLPVGPVDLEDGMPLRDQEARQAGAVGPGPLDAEGADRAQGPRPGLQCLVAPLADRDGRRAEAGTERVDRDGGVHVLVGVDADDDVGARGLVHGGGPPSRLRGPGDPAVGQDCDGTIALKLLSGHVPLDRQVPPGGADTSTRWHGASQGKGQAPRAAPILSQSRQLPFRLIDCSMPCRFSTSRYGSAASRADSSGRRNTSTEGLAMGTRRRRSDRSGRGVSRSPGRPGVARREDRRRFWTAIAAGRSSEDAAVGAGVSSAVGARWFREAGGMPPSTLARSSMPPSGRYLSFAEREEVALWRAQGHGVREVARRLGRAASTISRELRRNAATRGGALEYRATTAQWHAERAAQRPKPARLAANPALRTYVQDRLAGAVVAPGGAAVTGPAVPWKGRRHGRRQNRRWGMAWSPQQIARRLRLDFPGDEAMRISHEAVYQALYVQARGALRRELTACLRTGRALRVPRARARG